MSPLKTLVIVGQVPSLVPSLHFQSTEGLYYYFLYFYYLFNLFLIILQYTLFNFLRHHSTNNFEILTHDCILTSLKTNPATLFSHS